MSDISKSVGETSPELVEALKQANSIEHMKEVNRQWYVEHGGERDRFNPDKILLDNFKAPDESTGTVSRVVPIGGVKRLFTASSILELERSIGEALQAVDAAANAGTQPRGEDGKFVSRREMNAAEKVELDLRFRRGEISAPEYLKQSGELEQAVETFAKEKMGFDPEANFHKTWAAATEEFLKSPAGSDWPGGDANKEIVGRLLAENNLTDQPSAETLARVYEHMKEHRLVQPNPELVKREKDRFDGAASYEEINSLARAAIGMVPRNSNLWGR